MFRRFSLLILLSWGVATAGAEEPPASDWEYIDNGVIKLGVIRSSGAGIAYLSRSGTSSNVLDHYDRGRLVQQSYYGDDDGSLWVKRPWRYNPVQGGDYKGTGSTITEFRKTKTTLYARTIPRNWAGGEQLDEVVMEQWITLKDDVARIKFRMTYEGTNTHAPRHQEIPAMFVEPQFDTLVLYDGNEPWTDGPLTRRQPGFPNEGAKLAENWAAWVDANDEGVGIYVPIATEATCYRYRGGGNSNCSYIAPITTFALTPGKVFVYECYLALGRVTDLRRKFKALNDDLNTPPRAIVPAPDSAR